MKLSPCLELFFRELPFTERIEAVADAGFRAAEFWGHADKDLTAVAAAAERCGVAITSLTACGNLTDPEKHEQAEVELAAAIEAARTVGCNRLIVLSGNVIPGKTHCAHVKAIIDGLKRLAPAAEHAGVVLVIELLNSKVNHPGYFLDNSEDMAAVLRAVDHPNVKALYDIYHAGIMEGNIIEKIRTNLDIIGHFHAAGIPGRHEMKAGEQNYPAICREIDRLGFDGYLGLEYSPTKDSRTSLIETRQWLEQA
ncbi:MAG: TIM barrel protein [Kiritimatiellaeota bacterium]|nr:TIM barrel protein [Kiritimatiellota bacterium]